MKKVRTSQKAFSILTLLISVTTTALAQSSNDSAARAERQKQQIELSKTNENHQLLASLNGEWSFKGRHIPSDPTQQPVEIFGTVIRKGIWENRYFITETSSGKKIPMPWAEWKEMTYHDIYLEGYDNVKKKFFYTSAGNHWSTGYMLCEGSYEPATRTLTYEGEFEPSPGTIMKVVRIITFIDPDNFKQETHNSIHGKEVLRSESSFTRVKSGK